MKFRTVIILSLVVLLCSGLSVWAGVEGINDAEVLGELQEQGIYIPHNEPVVLPDSDSRAEVPQELIEELEMQPEPQTPEKTQNSKLQNI